MLSKTTEYALRAAVYLATSGGGSTVAKTTDEISRVTRAPISYLAKIMQGLVRAQVVTSQRGLYGGFILTKAPEDLTIYDIVQAVEPIPRILTCPLELEGHGGSLCRFHAILDRALEQTETLFRSTRLSDIIAEPEASVLGGHGPCPFPHNAPKPGAAPHEK